MQDTDTSSIQASRKSLVVNHRFHGPLDSGNGGYVVGLVASAIKGVAEVTLLKPPPLDTPLVLEKTDDRVRLMDQEVELAIGRPATLDLDVPPPPSLAEAEAAAARYPEFAPFIVPTCFVCGLNRTEGDGLCIHTGTLAGYEKPAVAAPWIIDESLIAEDGLIAPEFLYAALDCPGYFSVYRDKQPLVALLGRMTGEVIARPKAGETCIVTAWRIASMGRKHDVGTAVFRADGSILARARCTWIELKAPRLQDGKLTSSKP